MNIICVVLHRLIAMPGGSYNYKNASFLDLYSQKQLAGDKQSIGLVSFCEVGEVLDPLSRVHSSPPYLGLEHRRTSSSLHDRRSQLPALSQSLQTPLTRMENSLLWYERLMSRWKYQYSYDH